MYYPISCPSVQTIFIENHRFDICEVGEDRYNLLIPGNHKKPMGRFFVEVENNFIVDFRIAEELHNKGVENRWEIFCTTVQGARDKIMRFKKLLGDINNYKALLQSNPSRVGVYKPIINGLCKTVCEDYNIKLKQQ